MSAAGAWRFPIRFKLTAALAVPVAILLVVAFTQVAQARRTAQRANEQAELALAAEGPGSVYDALFDERSTTGLYLLGIAPADSDVEEDMNQARPVADEMVSELGDLVGGKPSRVQDIYRPAMDSLATLDGLRAQVDAYAGLRVPGDPEAVAIFLEVIEGYTAIIDALSDASIEVTAAIDEPSLRQGAELVRLGSRQGDLSALLIGHLLLSINNQDDVATRMVDLATAHGDLVSNDKLLRSSIRGPYVRYQDRLDDGEEMQQYDQIVRDTIAKSEYDVMAGEERGDNQDLAGEEWAYGLFREDVAGELQEQAESLRNDATRRQWAYLGMGLLVLSAAMAAAWLVSRSITGPLRSLTNQATTMAGEKLPGAVQQVLETPLGEDVVVPQVAPIVVATNDEVADVAQALTTVQDSALNLAVEQAVLRRNIADSFVNLGRRNQALLSRQLDFITTLEHNEADSEALANLFRLDHLATRMRRNAESLLVLGGADPPRQWGAPVRLSEIIRSALGEVEGYQRVVVRDIGPVSVVGSAAADLAHLLAELIENALVFSSPSTTVQIRGRNQPVPAAGYEPNPLNDPATAVGYALEVIDSGMGMHPDEIARANRRLAGAESFTIAPSKYLGHYVAGIIAARHDIAVQLRSSSASGTVAEVGLPPMLLATGQPQPAPMRELPSASN